MGFSSFSDIDPAKIHYGIWRKVLVAANVAHSWYDDSMIGPEPITNLYAAEPLAAAIMNGSKGIRHWQSHSSHTEHLLEWTMFGQGGSDGPMTFNLIDIAMYYPFIDCDSGDEQILDNTLSLTRHATGAGVRAYIVCQQTGVGNGAYTISYTNQDGVSGRTSSGNVLLPSAVSQLLTSPHVAAGAHVPFIPLEGTDIGMRSIDSITWTTPPGGLAAIVMCKPIASMLQSETTSYSEKQFHPRFPVIDNSAYLTILRTAGNAPPAGRSYFGVITTIKS